MILVAGGTGTTGTHIVRLLRARGEDVRVLTRQAKRAAHLQAVEVAEGDVRDPEAVRRAVRGARVVISAIQGFAGPGDISLESIDRDGNHNLFHAAREAGAEHAILISIKWAAPDSPMDLARMKWVAEEDLKATGLAWTILRPSCLMETWATLVGRPLLKTGKTTIYGHGRRLTNFVSALDLARFVELAVADPALSGQTIDVGAENLTLDQFLETFARVHGVPPNASHFPLPVMRIMAHAMRPFNLVMARHIQTGVVLHTRDTAFDAMETRRRFPSIPVTTLAELLRGERAEEKDATRAESSRHEVA